jgi:hypothetical protein
VNDVRATIASARSVGAPCPDDQVEERAKHRRTAVIPARQPSDAGGAQSVCNSGAVAIGLLEGNEIDPDVCREALKVGDDLRLS